MSTTVTLIIAGIFAAASVALLLGAAAIAVLIGALVAVLVYCKWWLDYRLICLDDDVNHCVIGFVAEFETAEGKPFPDNLDTDFSMNIGILGTFFGDSDLDAVSQVQPFGYLLKSTAATDPTRAANDPITQTLIFDLTGTNSPGDEVSDPYFGKAKMKVLHTEFEGAGVVILRDWVRVLIGLLVIAEALAIACSGGLFWACLLLIALALLFGGLGLLGLSLATADQANPGDIDKSLDSLAIGNIVLVRGRWVYDAGHVDENRGWNEIHPIRHCQIIQSGLFDGDWGAVFPLRINEWCEQVSLVETGIVKIAQQKPENGWEIHPLVDGCRPSLPDVR